MCLTHSMQYYHLANRRAITSACMLRFKKVNYTRLKKDEIWDCFVPSTRDGTALRRAARISSGVAPSTLTTFSLDLEPTMRLTCAFRKPRTSAMYRVMAELASPSRGAAWMDTFSLPSALLMAESCVWFREEDAWK